MPRRALIACALCACHQRDERAPAKPVATPAPAAIAHDPAIALGVSKRLEQGQIAWLAYDGDLLDVLSWDGVLAGSDPKEAAQRYLARWDLGAGSIERRAGEGDPITDASLAPAVHELAIATLDQHVRLVDSRTFQTLWEVEAGGETSCVAVSPDGELVLVGREDGSLELYGVGGTSAWSAKADGKFVGACAFSPDGRMFASGGDKTTVTVRDAASRRVIAKLEHPAPDPDSDQPLGVLSLAFSPDSRAIATGGWDRQVRVFALPSGSRARAIAVADDPFTVAWSPDGAWLAYGGRGNDIQLWHAKDGAPGPKLEGHGNVVSAIAFSPDGKTLASGSWDKTIRTWDVATGAELGATGHADRVRAVGLTPDGGGLVSVGADRRVIAWDAARAAERGRITEPYYYGAYAIAPDASAVARLDASGLAVIDEPSGKLRFEHDLAGEDTDEKLAFSPSGAELLVTIGGELRLYDAHTGAKLRAIATPEAVLDAGLTDGGRAAWWVDDKLHVVDATTGAVRATIALGAPLPDRAALSPDGRTAAIARDGVVSLWDVATGAHRADVPGLAAPVFAPDGRTFAAIGGGAIVVVDAASGHPIETLAPAGGASIDALDALAYAANGDLVAGAGATVELWRVRR